MASTPIYRQLLIVTSPQLTALSIGALNGYPSILLNQLKSNSSSIPLDIDSGSWIASINGIAGIPSILMPTIMQWKGRKFAYLLSSFIVACGCFLTSFATNLTTLLIAEALEGLGYSSSGIVCLVALSELVNPKFRSISMLCFALSQAIGLALVILLGYYFHWKTVIFIMGLPVLMAFVMALLWPESPFWLAHIGETAKCRETFIWLRGTHEDSLKELDALLRSTHKTCKRIDNSNLTENAGSKYNIRDFFKKILRKDFYLPTAHMLLLMLAFYWSGALSIFIYSLDIIKIATGISDPFVPIVLIDVIIMVSCINSIILIRFFKNKQVYLACGVGVISSLLFSSVWSYLSKYGIVAKDSIITMCSLLAFIMFNLSGLSSLVANLSTELMPVKHRGLGGILFIIFVSILRTSSIKCAPYLFESIDLWGTFLLYALIALTGLIFTWLYIPETKGRTLVEIERYYNHGYYDTSEDDNKDNGRLLSKTSQTNLE